LAGCQFVVRKGAYEEEIEGINALTAMMITRGTGTRNSEQISLDVESMGASIKATPAYDEFALTLGSLSEYLPNLLEIASDCFLNSQFDKTEFDKIYKKHHSSILQDNADISYLSQYLLARTYFEGTGYSKIIPGTLSSINHITRDLVYSHYTDNIKNNPSSIFFFGNFNRDMALEFVQRNFGHLSIDVPKIQDREVKMQNGLISVIDKKDSNQAYLRLARPTINRHHPDYPYVQLVNTIFGGFFMSRLNHILREEKGYTYGIHSIIDNRHNIATNIVVSSVNIDKAAESIEIIKEVVRNLISNPITTDEMNRAIRYSTGAFLRSTETINQLAMMVKSLELSDLDSHYFEYVYNKIVTAKLSNLHEAVENYFADDNFVITAAGDLQVITSQLEQIGDIKIYEI